MSQAYENAVPVEDSESYEEFKPLSLDDADSSTPNSEWNYDQPPLLWLFGTEGRGKIVNYAIDAVRGGDPIFLNKSGLGDEANVSRHSVHRHIDDLVELGIFTKRASEGSVTRYRPNKESRVLRALSTVDTEIRNYAAEPT